MSNNHRGSPRAAIRDWLIHTDSIAKSKLPSPPERRHRHQRSVRRSRRGASPPDITPSSANRFRQETGQEVKFQNKKKHRRHANSNADACKCHLLRGQQESSNNQPNDANLATRLDLQAPFREFGHHDTSIGPSRDRRHRAASKSSYLKPATTLKRPGSPHDVRPLHDESKRRLHSCDYDTSSGDSVSTSESSSTLPPSPAKPEKSYERHLRHKTREDRYEPRPEKQKTKRKSEEDQNTHRKPKKRRRTEKSGKALMHDFTAQNVSKDRLTLKPTEKLGLFGRSRASSPVKRRGLPDLAFSELSFLNSRREKPEEGSRPVEIPRNRKSRKAADAEAEISRYFTTTKQPNLDPAVAPILCKPAQSSAHRTSNPLIHLPENLFLGFGGCGPHATSPLRMIKELDARHVPSRSQRDTKSPTRSTSYLTWSRSGAPSQTSSKSRHQGSVVHEASKITNDAREMATCNKETPKVRKSPPSASGEFNTVPVSDPVQGDSGGKKMCSPVVNASDGHRKLDRETRNINHESTNEKRKHDTSRRPKLGTRTEVSSYGDHELTRAQNEYPVGRLLRGVNEPRAQTTNEEERQLQLPQPARPSLPVFESLGATLEALLEEIKPLPPVSSAENGHPPNGTVSKFEGDFRSLKDEQLQEQDDSLLEVSHRFKDYQHNADVQNFDTSDQGHPGALGPLLSAPRPGFQPLSSLRSPLKMRPQQFRPSSLPEAQNNAWAAWKKPNEFSTLQNSSLPRFCEPQPHHFDESYAHAAYPMVEEELIDSSFTEHQDMTYIPEENDGYSGAPSRGPDSIGYSEYYRPTEPRSFMESKMGDDVQHFDPIGPDTGVDYHDLVQTRESEHQTYEEVTDLSASEPYQNDQSANEYGSGHPAAFEAYFPRSLSTHITRPPLRELPHQYERQTMVMPHEAQENDVGLMGFWTPHKLY